MRQIKEAKVLNILALKERGIGSAEAIRISGYGRSTVKAVYSGNYEMIPFLVPGEWELEEETVMTAHGPAIRITKNDYELQDSDYFTDATTESAEDSYIRKEEAEDLYSALDILSDKDREIIQAKADGQSDRQIITEYNTSAGHIKKIQEKLQGVLDFS